MANRVVLLGVAVAAVALAIGANRKYGWGGEAALAAFRGLKDRLGLWAIPVYVGAHTITLALCLPSAVFFEAGASLLFGFLPAVFCVFFAKVLGASLSFWIGRRERVQGLLSREPLWISSLVFRSSKSAMDWAQRSKYFHLLVRGVEQDGWKFVLLARFSPMPSYVVNYAMAATEVGFLVDFLLPTVIGCLPMILQNTSIGSLAGAAVAASTGSQKSRVLSYLFPLLGITSSVLISLRIKKYSSGLAVDAELNSSSPSKKIDADNKNIVDPSQSR